MRLHVVLVEIITTIKARYAGLSCDIEVLFAFKAHLAGSKDSFLRAIIHFCESSYYLRVNSFDVIPAKFCHFGTSFTKGEKNFVREPHSCSLPIGQEATTMNLNRGICVEEAHFHCGGSLSVASNSKSVLVLLINAIGVQKDGGATTERHNQAIHSPGKTFTECSDSGFDSANPKARVTFE